MEEKRVINSLNATYCLDERDKILELSNILSDIDWEKAGRRFTRSYWKVQYYLDDSTYSDYKLGSNLMEEVVACLLGGHGFRAEIGLLAFHRMKNLRLIRTGVSLEEIEEAISAPFRWNGKDVHYRFSHQKSKYIYSFLQRSDINEFDTLCGSSLRNKLMTIKGIGPKTASWIARNYDNCEDVAIVDIHIYRAGRLAGFVNPKWDMQKDYYKIEKSFLEFCHSINALPSKMDSIMWNQMKESNRRAIELLNLQL
jgi:thermostable 8-oxoguanine DNA glycosylase